MFWPTSDVAHRVCKKRYNVAGRCWWVGIIGLCTVQQVAPPSPGNATHLFILNTVSAIMFVQHNICTLYVYICTVSRQNIFTQHRPTTYWRDWFWGLGRVGVTYVGESQRLISTRLSTISTYKNNKTWLSARWKHVFSKIILWLHATTEALNHMLSDLKRTIRKIPWHLQESYQYKQWQLAIK